MTGSSPMPLRGIAEVPPQAAKSSADLPRALSFMRRRYDRAGPREPR